MVDVCVHILAGLIDTSRSVRVEIKTMCLHPHGSPSGHNVYRVELSYRIDVPLRAEVLAET